MSSLAAIGGLIMLQTRLDDAMDTNADGAPTAISRASRSWPSTRRRARSVWQRDLARAEMDDPNDVPKFFVCPTPAGFASDGGSALVAAASSLAPAVVVFDAASGLEQSRVARRGRRWRRRCSPTAA